MTQIRPLQLQSVAVGDEGPSKRSQETRDVPGFDAMISAGSSGKKACDTEQPMSAEPETAQGHRRKKSEGGKPSSAPLEIALLLETAPMVPQPAPRVSETGAPQLRTEATKIPVSTTSLRSVTSDVLENATKNDVSRIAVKVTDQQTHFSPTATAIFVGSTSASTAVSPSVASVRSVRPPDGAKAAARRDEPEERQVGGHHSELTSKVTDKQNHAAIEAVELGPGGLETAVRWRAPGRSPAGGEAAVQLSGNSSRPSVNDIVPAQDVVQPAGTMAASTSQVLSALLDAAAADASSAEPVSHHALLDQPSYEVGSPLKKLTIELQPGSMGLVQVELTSRNGELSIRLDVELAETLADLVGDSAQLADRIGDAGYQISDFAISQLKSDRTVETAAGSQSPLNNWNGNTGSSGRQGQSERDGVPRDREAGSRDILQADGAVSENALIDGGGLGRRLWRV